jgi:hypothetical protein
LQFANAANVWKAGCDRRKMDTGEGHLWVAPALQVFSGDIRGHFRQYCRLSGLFMFWHCLHWP